MALTFFMGSGLRSTSSGHIMSEIVSKKFWITILVHFQCKKLTWEYMTWDIRSRVSNLSFCVSKIYVEKEKIIRSFQKFKSRKQNEKPIFNWHLREIQLYKSNVQVENSTWMSDYDYMTTSDAYLVISVALLHFPTSATRSDAHFPYIKLLLNRTMLVVLLWNG